MKEDLKKQMLRKHNAFLLVVTMVAVTAATFVEALVPSTSTHTVEINHRTIVNKAKKRRRYPLLTRYSTTVENDLDLLLSSPAMSAETTAENDLDLLLSLPAMSAEIKQQCSSGAYHKNNYERRERKRKRKPNEIKNDDETLKSTGLKQNYGNKNRSTGFSGGDSYITSELPYAIPKLSDILGGRAVFKDGNNKEPIEKKFRREIKIINAMPQKRREDTALTRTVNNNVPTEGSTARRVTSDKSINAEKKNMQMISSAAISSMKNSQKPPSPTLLPWRANYKSSKRTQGRLRKAFTEPTPSSLGHHSRAQHVLDTLLQIPPEYCNAVNLVCALTYSAKAMGHHRMDNKDKNLNFRKSLQETFDILHDLLVVHREEGLFSPRQFCNVVWAIAKHVDRDPDLLLLQRDNEVANDTGNIFENGLNINKVSDSPEFRLDETINEITRELTSILLEDDNDVGSEADVGSMSKSKPIKSSFQQPKIKIGEICMACWAFGKLRHRNIPPGWPGPPQMGAVKTPVAIVADWKTEQLGTRREFGSRFGNIENDEGGKHQIEISETDKLFDAMGYALCQNAEDNKQNDIADEGSPPSTMLEDCTWSELANVGWAFASHGRCRSKESELLLKSIAQEAANRLKDGNIANNYQNFLVRDITQLVWSLGTLQSDNFRLADDLVLLVESLTSNLLLGQKTGSRFAKGRPLRRWSCADLVQTSVALAHARIDENLLLRAIYEEGNYRLMEGASSSRKSSSLTQLSEKRNPNLPLGEDRRSFHPWEASILLWAQARLFLREEEGVEFDEFAEDAPLFFLKALHRSRGSFAESSIGPQEQANIVWSLVILEKFGSPEAIILIDLIFVEAARSCKKNEGMQLEHAHQLWQAYFILKEDCPEAVKRVPQWFVSYLEDKWSLEKARLKMSSARHQSLSSTLELMGVDHINEHDEDIDVAIILQPNARWVHETDMDEDDRHVPPNHETDMDEDERHGSRTDEDDYVSVAVEFDGPNHFTRVRTNSQEPESPRKPGSPRHSPEPPRALGHTVLKYRLLTKQGWTVVRVPYYEFDKIPFWASMERQRYLQRKLKTHANIQFSEVDVSEYKAITPNRRSRFD